MADGTDIEVEDLGNKGRYVLRGPDGAEAEMTFTNSARTRSSSTTRRCPMHSAASAPACVW